MLRLLRSIGPAAVALSLLAACGSKTPEATGGAGGTGGAAPSDTGGASGTTSSGSPSSSSGGSNDPAQICVDQINAYRATLGLPAYARWTDNESCAAGEAAKDGASGQPHSAFPSCGEGAQNECPGWPGPPEKMIGDCLAQMWAEGPGADFSQHGHYINMSNPKYTKVACGFTQLADGSVWATQDFE